MWTPRLVPLAFSEAFTTFDTAKWRQKGVGWGSFLNGVTKASESCVTVENGICTLTTRKDGATYYTGAISTYKTFLYGTFECRMKIPSGRGLLPAFWMMDAQSDVEIDMEVAISATDPLLTTSALQLNIHNHPVGGEGSAGDDGTTVYLDSPLSDDYHIYKFKWEPDSITFYLDGEQVWVYDGPLVPQVPLQIVVFTVGGGAWEGAITDADLPQTLLIDYVRVSRRWGKRTRTSRSWTER